MQTKRTHFFTDAGISNDIFSFLFFDVTLVTIDTGISQDSSKFSGHLNFVYDTHFFECKNRKKSRNSRLTKLYSVGCSIPRFAIGESLISALCI